MMAQPNKYVSDNTDCDDNNDTISPDGDDICNGKKMTVQMALMMDQKYYADTDLDGFGDSAQM